MLNKANLQTLKLIIYNQIQGSPINCKMDILQYLEIKPNLLIKLNNICHMIRILNQILIRFMMILIIQYQIKKILFKLIDIHLILIACTIQFIMNYNKKLLIPNQNHQNKHIKLKLIIQFQLEIVLKYKVLLKILYNKFVINVKLILKL